MKIKRRISGLNVEEFDRKGRLIYEEEHSGVSECIFKTYKKYDDNDNIIYDKLIIEDKLETNINENFYDYDERGNEIYYKRTLNGEIKIEIWREYDENNNLIYSKDKNGNEWFYRYDENNRCIYLNEPFIGESYCEYDDNGNTITGYDECIFYDEDKEI